MSLVQRTALRRLQTRPGFAPSPVTRNGALPAARRNYSWGAMTDSIAQGMVSFHAIGMPWWVTIPVVAATVNFSIRLPLQLYGQKIRNERQKVQPLAYAWSTVVRREAEHRIKQRRMKPADQATERRAAWRRLGLVYKDMYKKFGCPTWKSFVPWTSMVPFVAFADAIRKIAGVSAWSGFQSPLFPPPTAEPPEPLELTEHFAGLVDPSLCEGGLLWFSDLSVADPYWLLPLSCVAVLGLQTWPKIDPAFAFAKLMNKDPQKVETGHGRLQEMVQRVMIMVPFLPLFWLNLPSAVVLYALTTFSLNALNAFIAVKVYPKPKLRFGPMTKVSDPSPFLHSNQVPEKGGPQNVAHGTPGSNTKPKVQKS